MQKPDFGKRAVRRQELSRKKRQARKIYPHDKKARSANHLKMCSCHMCGNPRRHFKSATLQEQRADIAMETT
jgi:hypothetical protein